MQLTHSVYAYLYRTMNTAPPSITFDTSNSSDTSTTFGARVRGQRQALRLGLRDFAIRADIDAGNLSKIERGRMAPPLDPALLTRILSALQLDGTERGETMRDLAALENGRLPASAIADAEVMAALPLFLCSVRNRAHDVTTAEKLVSLIRQS